MKKYAPHAYTVQDHFFQKAKQEGYRARSVYKLLELQEKFHILKKGDRVLDLGAAPGSFMQGAGKIVGNEGQVIGLDLQKIKPFPEKNKHTFVCDIFDQEKVKKNLETRNLAKADVILSDMAPNTSGMSDVDQYKSVELNLEALKVADRFLKKGGNLVLKVFVGEDFPELVREVKRRFKIFKNFKPKASRDRSFETYVVGMDFMGK